MAGQRILFLPRLNLEHLQQESLLFLATDPSTDGDLLDLMAKYFLTTEPLIQKIIQHPHVLETTLNYLRIFGSDAYQEWIKLHRDVFASTDSKPASQELNLFQQAQQMTVSEKIQLALKGNKEARTLMIKDSNKQVILAVLSSPRLTEQEVELIAQSKNVSEEILRIIANNRSWAKNYSIVAALVNNPKTPVGLSLGFLKNLKARDLNTVAKNKGVPEVIRTSAGRLLQVKKAGQ